MNCPHCRTGEVIPYRMVISSGVGVVVKRCDVCGRKPEYKRPFYPKADYPNWDELPLPEDMTADAPPCGVAGCTNKGTEYHHWAPRHLFEDAEFWPTDYLCREHHALWHKTTKTGAYKK